MRFRKDEVSSRIHSALNREANSKKGPITNSMRHRSRFLLATRNQGLVASPIKLSLGSLVEEAKYTNRGGCRRVLTSIELL